MGGCAGRGEQRGRTDKSWWLGMTSDVELESYSLVVGVYKRIN